MSNTPQADRNSPPDEEPPDTDTHSGYGLPTKRDAEGNLEAVDHDYEWDGTRVRIKLVPPTISQLEEYERLGEDASADELAEVVDRHLVEPSTPAGEMTVRELTCYVEGIVDYNTAGSGVAQAAREELAARDSAPGN